MIYFDYAATSIKRKEILKNIFENMENFDGNPDSLHALGRSGKKVLEESRLEIAKSINANPNHIIFTSSASEANNTILSNFKDDFVITSKIEHDSILNTVNKEKTIFLDVDKNGYFSLDELKEKLRDDVKLVSLMFVNNEIGSIEPVYEIGEFLKDRDVFFHVDCVQAYSHIDIDVEKLHCNSLSLSGHKIGGINSFGVLYCNKKINPLIKGGEQEKDRRAGTSFTMGAYSMAKAFPKACSEREKIKELKSYFVKKLEESNFLYEINGSLENSTDHILNLYFPKVKNELLLTYLDMNGICISVGSACRAGSVEASNVIKNMYDENRARHSVRFSFGFTNTKEDIDYTFEVLKKLRGIDGKER